MGVGRGHGGSVGIDVFDVAGENRCQVPFGDDQKSVGACAAGSADPPFRDRVRSRALGESVALARSVVSTSSQT